MSAKTALFVLCWSGFFNMALGQKADGIDRSKKPLITESIRGRWANESDSNAVMVISKKHFTTLYQNKTVEEGSYLLSHSCDERNKVSSKTRSLDKNIFFVMGPGREGPFCYELLGVTEETLSWMEPINGKIFIFKKMAN